MHVSLSSLLHTAQQHRFAVGAFNIHSPEGAMALLQAAKETRSPIILSTSEGGVEYLGMDVLGAAVHELIEQHPYPVCYHLDHGRNPQIVKAAIDSTWYDSVMIDASHEAFSKNVQITKRIVLYAHKHGVDVEAEIGRLQGIEDHIEQNETLETTPEEALLFAQKTECQALAISVGTRHGILKWLSTPKIHTHTIAAIRAHTNIPLVLHGASAIPTPLLNELRRLGVHLPPSHGTSNRSLVNAIAAGITKVNIDSDLRLAWNVGVRTHLKKQVDNLDPRHILSAGSRAIMKFAIAKIQLLGSANKAKLYV